MSRRGFAEFIIGLGLHDDKMYRTRHYSFTVRDDVIKHVLCGAPCSPTRDLAWGLAPAQSARGVDATYRKRGHRQTAHLTGETCVIGRDVIATTRHLDTNTERLARCIACIRRRIIMGKIINRLLNSRIGLVESRASMHIRVVHGLGWVRLVGSRFFSFW